MITRSVCFDHRSWILLQHHSVSGTFRIVLLQNIYFPKHESIFKWITWTFDLISLTAVCLCDFSGTGKSKKREQCKNTQMYPLSETQYCPCNKYNAQSVGNWSDCILPEGGRVEGLLGMKVQGDIKECGQGYRFQAMVCYDQDNRLVETSRCNSHGG